jgi:alpha-methylacyl-CoA racemase
MGPLQGLKIVEMSAIGPVPLAGMLLADMGAEVVIVDKANDMWIMPNDVLRRGKRAIEVDMKSAQGVATVKSLINAADIVLEGFRPGVMERLGIGPQEFSESNAKLIYGRMTGWGQTGPLAKTAAHDLNYIALTGALHAMGRADSAPVPPLNLVGDYGGGTMFLVMGVLAALHESKSSGTGQVIDAAIIEGTANLMSMFYTMHENQMWSPKRASNMLDSAAHYYDTYQTSDNKYISLGAIEPQFYALMREKMGLDDADFDEQHNPLKWPALKEKVAAVVKSKSRQAWSDLLEGTDVCFAPVLDYVEAAEHPHMQERQVYVEIEGQLQPAPAPRFSRTESQVSGAFQGREDTDSVLTDWNVG